MKKPVLPYLIAFAFLLNSCKKLVQQAEQNALTNLITSGTWAVSRYYNNGADITTIFSGYSFQFKDDGTVAGIKGTLSVNGTWAGDITTRTITSDFPGTADPLDKLNTVWTVKDSYDDSVSAIGSINGSSNKLELKKQ